MEGLSPARLFLIFDGFSHFFSRITCPRTKNLVLLEAAENSTLDVIQIRRKNSDFMHLTSVICWKMQKTLFGHKFSNSFCGFCMQDRQKNGELSARYWITLSKTHSIFSVRKLWKAPALQDFFWFSTIFDGFSHFFLGTHVTEL